jgi:hypothetical protein|tara:strand:+ start:489 stop:791 length:303 start_codon:yes stop_codon:yes gene_type:complete
MTEITNELINKLEQISDSTHLPLEQRLMDTAIWFHRNKDEISDIPKKVEFLTKTLDIFLELTAMIVDRQQQVEGRRKSAALWLPRGMEARDANGKVVDFG